MVLCRQAGFSGGCATPLTASSISPLTTLAVITNLTCQGDEYSIQECGYDEYLEVSECKATVGVTCQLDKTGALLDFKLWGASLISAWACMHLLLL